MLTYVCALPDVRRPGRIPELLTADPDAVAAFVDKWREVEGRSVYRCVSLLRDDARRRALETVAALEFIHVDIDFRSVAATPEEVDATLRQLPLQPEVRDSGGGRHVVWWLKEPALAGTPEFEHVNALRSRLTRALGGDPAPNHAAALLREPGTWNRKHGAPRLCQIIQEGEASDITEIEGLAELLEGSVLIEPVPTKPKVNGHDPGTWRPVDGTKTPVDVDARLAAMQFKGPEDSCIHYTQLQCMGSLLRAGVTLDCATEIVLEATRRCVAGVPEAASWNWRSEEIEIRRMGTDLINKAPELAIMLPDNLKTRWDAKVAEGRKPRVDYTPAFGWRVCGDGPRHEKPGRERPQKDTESPKQGPGGGSKPGGVFAIHPFVRIDPLTLPPRQWLYGKHYQRRTVSATIAPGGTGKSSLNLAEAIAMATARNLLGEQPEERLRVWYHNGEDNRLEIDRRILAVCQQYDIPQEELEGWLFVTTGAEIPLRVAQGYSNLELDAPLIRRIRECMGDLEIAVASLDPLITLHGVPEGDNGKMYRVVRIFADMGEELDASFELAHHTRKGPPGGGAYEYTADDMRGASAVRDAVRAARILNHMTAQEAEDVSIPEYDRGTYFRVDRAKGNYSRAAKLATWRRFVSVELPNEDEVGVVVPWEFPGQGQQTPEKAAADQKAEEVLLRLLDKLTTRGSRVSESRAPGVFADEPEARKAQVGKAAIKAAIGRLLDAGRIRVEEGGRADRSTRYLVPWHGSPKPFRTFEV